MQNEIVIRWVGSDAALPSDEPTENLDSAVPPFLLHVESPRPNQTLIPGLPIVVTGFLLTVDPCREIVVTLGKVTAFAKFGLPRSDLATKFPDNNAIGHAGFSCLLQAASGEASGPVSLQVTARTHKGYLRTLDVPVVFGPEAAAAGAGTREVEPVVSDNEAMQFRVDRAAVDRTGILHVSGWALAHGKIEAVDVYVDGQHVGKAHYGLERPDVELAWPDYGNALASGFALAVDARELPERIEVKVKARAAGGVFREVTKAVQRRDLAPRRRTKEHNELVCDVATLTTSGRLRLVGWAVCSAGIERMRVLLEGEPIGDATLGGDRPDVGNKFPSIAQARTSGFAFEAQIEPAKIKVEHVLVLEIVRSDGELIPFKVAVAPQEIVEPAAAPAASEVVLFIDEPQVVDGVVAQPVKGGLSIVGWTLAKEGIASVEVQLDGVFVGNAHHGMRRPDIAGAFPDYSGALLSGFGFSMAQRALSEGQHTVAINARSKNGQEKKVEFSIQASGGIEEEGPWSLRTRIGATERRFAEILSTQVHDQNEFLVWVHCRGSDREAIRTTLQSLSGQLYGNWAVVLVGCGSEEAAGLLDAEFAKLAPRLFWLTADELSSDRTSSLRDDVWVMPIAAGDRLSADALLEFAVAAAQASGSEIIYADERRLNPASQRVEAFFKPRWSPDLLWSTNYIGRPWCVRSDLVRRAGISARDFLDYGHYDFVLRCSGLAAHIAHIPLVLCERPAAPTETGETEMRALGRAAARAGSEPSVEPGRIGGTYRLRGKSPPNGRVSIIIPTCAARGLVKVCLESLRKHTTHADIEIICVDNILDEASAWKPWLRDNADVVVEILDTFNWSRFNNLAAREASGEFLLFLNDDIEIIQPDWLEPLLELAARPEVGVVGPQLLYPDRKVQHAGMFLSGPIGRHAFRYCDENDPGYHGLALTQRNVIAVTGACMLVRADTFRRLGEFEEAHAVINNDVDFCLKAHDAGLRNVFTPFSTLIHHELASRAQLKDDHDVSAFTARWKGLVAAGDPFHHPNLSRSSDNFQYEAEPVRAVFAVNPLYRAEDIKRVLAVKLDHIGDFITAFPAFQRIKDAFPQCRLYVLAAPASLSLARLEPCIDEVIPFEFFHARSGLGQKTVGEAELGALAAKLKLLDIDVALDLRKHPDTRSILRHTGARWTAGFDWLSQFPWLDIALTWEGDSRATGKRSHIADDLVRLIDAVAASGRPSSKPIRRSGEWQAQQLAMISRLPTEHLYGRPVVCIHPSSGNEIKQWPPKYFAWLADALIETEDVNIVLIGAPDEKELADSLCEPMANRARVTSLVGHLKLDQLALFISTCSLFIGNDSGPKHLAAALGVPTVGIHSGVVDAREWGPLGHTAVAVKREMTCAPCYSARPEDCHRGLACLVGLSPAAVLPVCRRMLAAGRGSRRKDGPVLMDLPA